jgi:ABC-type arginine transport system permease subunit
MKTTNILSRNIAGLIITSIGVYVSLKNFSENYFVTLLYGVPIIIIGIFIFYNQKEDQIEKIKVGKLK